MSTRRSALGTTGDVLEDIKGSANLRSFGAAFLSQFFPTDDVASAFRMERLFGYSKTEGEPELRTVVAELTGVAARNVIITDGAAQALFLIILAGLSADDTVLVPRPTFPAYLRIASYRGCSFEFYDWRADGSDLIDRLGSSKGPSPSAVIINSPHNPTGIVLDDAVYDEVLRLAAAKRCLVIFDDAYAWLERPANQITHVNRKLWTAHPAGTLVGIVSLGKLLCLPGMRLGFIVADDQELLEKIVEAKRHLTHSSCPASETLAASLLLSAEWAEAKGRLLNAITGRRHEFNRIATQLGARPVTGARGLYAYASTAAAIANAGVEGVPGSVFESSNREARYCLAAADSDWTRFAALSRY
ncbi:pyridoxal phosphate-dependent aminotransferase [Bradyrhizobium sp. SZCCHNR3015]|uniref:pyridoxal phosphate-dependent aminotransferase n=1 Tax=Bradyrhizobium sp. SZCCHNR3015 TaxID=3057395 RepID=UPI002916F09D|nr:pyridoxal phosphate-dependent aminotransferase [Bradyrhizobium sp. SZCCHNR3015]